MPNRCARLVKFWYLEELLWKNGSFESNTSITNYFNRYEGMSGLLFGEATKAGFFDSIVFRHFE